MHIERVSDEFLTVEEGSLYPALHRMAHTSRMAVSAAYTFQLVHRHIHA